MKLIKVTKETGEIEYLNPEHIMYLQVFFDEISIEMEDRKKVYCLSLEEQEISHLEAPQTRFSSVDPYPGD